MANRRRAYICIASRYAEPNILPPLWQPDHFSHVLVLKGLTGRSEDADQSSLPAKRYRILLRARLNAPIEVREVSALSFEEVHKMVGAWLGERDTSVSEVVLNVTGGMVPTKLGANWACYEWASADAERGYRAVYYDPQSKPSLMVVGAQGDASVPQAVAEDCLKIEDLLILGGHKISSVQRDFLFPEASLEALDQLATRRNIKRQIAISIAFNRVASSAGAFDERRTNDPFPRPIINLEWLDKGKLRQELASIWRDLSPLLPPGGDIDISASSISVRTARALSYVRGGWLEEAVAARLADRLAGTSGVEIATNVELTLDEGKAVATPLVRELDVIIRHRDQLHVIECKSGRYARPQKEKDPAERGCAIGGDAIDRLIAIRKLISGPRATVALAASRIPSDSSQQKMVASLLKRAKADNIELWLGDDLPKRIDAFADGILARSTR